MTEAEWLTSEDPFSTLSALYRSWPHPHHNRHRKLRLLACACCRLDQKRASGAGWESAIDSVERFANSEITRRVMENDISHLPADADGTRLMAARPTSFDAAFFSLFSVLPRQANPPTVAGIISRLVTSIREVVRPRPKMVQPSPEAILRWQLMRLLRCIFGNPFRPVAFSPAWRSETVVALASAIYAERAFDRLPVLADALEEAGCDHADVLSHCRGPGPHVRGCWVVDGVLEKS